MKISEMLDSPEYQAHEEQTFYSNDSFISLDRDTSDRIQEYAETGSDGRTHGEVIDCWREFAESIEDEVLQQDIDEIEQWHIDNGSITEIIG